MKFTSGVPKRKAIVHADDFGITLEQSRRILDCARPDSEGRGGALNSVSVMVTSPAFHECAELLRTFEGARRAAGGAGYVAGGGARGADAELLVGLHVNIVEGHCASDAASIPLLVDAEGVFKRGFGGVLASSLVHPGKMRKQVAKEVGAQIELFLGEFPERRDRLRLDSHQHFHMIPAVFDGLVNALEVSGCTVEHLRVPVEPLSPFARSAALGRIAPINAVKHVVLNALWQFNKRKVAGLASHSAVFCGINFSGCMTLENVGCVLGAFADYAAAAGMQLELLFHPGGIDDEADCLNPRLPGFVRFYLSDARRAEALAAKYVEIG